MKRFMSLLLLVPLLLFSCDKIEDANTIDFDTNMDMYIDVGVEGNTAVLVKSAADYTFSESGYASLYDNSDLWDYLDHIKSIEVDNLEIMFYGLESGAQINSITLSVSGVGDIVTLQNITSANSTQHPTISSSVLTQLANHLINNLEITATVSGTTDTGPMWFGINISYDLLVKVKAV
ncbi:hypothetical protein [uncultured Draconibacterium sp.]|uniref:hypothetical protein n=1 Tax=uncultured Draconibacterium sp. TaxID=1573823 RepID=UPI00321724E4